MRYFTKNGVSLEPKQPQKISIDSISWSEMTYSQKHKWVDKHYRVAKGRLCERCNRYGRKYEWSNIDHEYKQQKKYWMRVCRSCHSIIERNNCLTRKAYIYRT